MLEPRKTLQITGSLSRRRRRRPCVSAQRSVCALLNKNENAPQTHASRARQCPYLVFSAAYVPCYMRSLYMCTISRSDRSPCAHLCIVFAEPATPPPPPPHTLTTPFTKGLCCCCCCCARKHSGFLSTYTRSCAIRRPLQNRKYPDTRTHAHSGTKSIDITANGSRAHFDYIVTRALVRATNFSSSIHNNNQLR